MAAVADCLQLGHRLGVLCAVGPCSSLELLRRSMGPDLFFVIFLNNFFYSCRLRRPGVRMRRRGQEAPARRHGDSRRGVPGIRAGGRSWEALRLKSVRAERRPEAPSSVCSAGRRSTGGVPPHSSCRARRSPGTRGAISPGPGSPGLRRGSGGSRGRPPPEPPRAGRRPGAVSEHARVSVAGRDGERRPPPAGRLTGLSESACAPGPPGRAADDRPCISPRLSGRHSARVANHQRGVPPGWPMPVHSCRTRDARAAAAVGGPLAAPRVRRAGKGDRRASRRGAVFRAVGTWAPQTARAAAGASASFRYTAAKRKPWGAGRGAAGVGKAGGGEGGGGAEADYRGARAG